MEEREQLVIWNPGAGSAEQAAGLRRELESRAGVTLRETSSGDETRKLANRAAREGLPLVVAAGGDGTVNAVINGLYEAGSKTVLGILPLGTGNDLCRSLGIPLDPFEASQLVTNGDHVPRMIDLVRAESNDRKTIFANLSSGGNSQRVPGALTNEMKQNWGAWSYLRGAVEVLGDLTGFTAEIKIDEQPEQSLVLWNIVVANGKTVGGGVAVAPRADIEDGLLDLVLIRDGTPLDVAALSAKFFLGDYLNDDRVLFQRARNVKFNSDPPMPFLADGEDLGTSPIEFTVLPHALSILGGPSLDGD